MQARVTVDALVRVNDTRRRGVADDGAAEDVRRHRDVKDVVPPTGGEPSDTTSDAPYGVVADRDPPRVRFAVARARRQPPAERTLPHIAADRVVVRLHDEGDDRLFRPAVHAQVARHHHGMAGDLEGPAERPDPPAIGEGGGQQPHRVVALAVAHRLDVGVVVRVERRGDGDSAGVVDVVPERARPQDCLGVRAGELAEPRRQVREDAVIAHAVQQLLGADRTSGQDDLAGDDRVPPLAYPGVGAHGCDVVTAVGSRSDRRHRRQRADLGTTDFGEVQVVLEERVLRPVPAAGHALAALGAADPARSGATEVGVGGLDSRFAEVDADRRGDERPAGAHLLGDGPHHLVGRSRRRVYHDAEHAPGLVVVGCQLLTPVGDVAPLGVGIEGRHGFVERVGVDERPAPDAGPGQDHHVAQQRDPLDAEQPEPRGPEERAHPPGGLR